MAAFVLAVYAVVVLGGDALIGRSDSPALALSVLATSVVALGFEPVQRRLEVVVPRRSRAPYDVLRRFGSTGTHGPVGEEVPGRMARLLGEGLGVRQVEVWLTVQDELVLAAAWPEAAAPVPQGADAAGWREVTVRHGGRVYGVLRLQQGAG